MRKLTRVEYHPNSPRSRVAGRDARLPQRQGRRVRGSTGACEQQQPGGVCISRCFGQSPADKNPLFFTSGSPPRRGLQSTYEQSRDAPAPQAGQLCSSTTLAPNTGSGTASVDSDGSTLSAWWFMSAPHRGHFIFLVVLMFDSHRLHRNILTP
jgi:hypothetical protein